MASRASLGADISVLGLAALRWGRIVLFEAGAHTQQEQWAGKQERYEKRPSQSGTGARWGSQLFPRHAPTLALILDEGHMAGAIFFVWRTEPPASVQG